MSVTIQQFDFSVNLLRAIIWQYEKAVNLQALLKAKQNWYNSNQQSFWTNWIKNVFDLRTANDFGLTVWSIILGIPIRITKVPDSVRKAWGFASPHYNFERGTFGNTTGATYGVSSDTARIILRMRYFALTSAGTVPEINRMLKILFGSMGNAYLSDNHDMTQLYTFNFSLPADLALAFTNLDILPRPAGVGSSFRVIVNQAWGFDANHNNFNNSNFSEG